MGFKGNSMFFSSILNGYTLSEAGSGVNWADLMAAQGAFGVDVYDRPILRLNSKASFLLSLFVLVDLS